MKEKLEEVIKYLEDKHGTVEELSAQVNQKNAEMLMAASARDYVSAAVYRDERNSLGNYHLVITLLKEEKDEL